MTHELTAFQKAIVSNVETAAGLSELPKDLSPELKKPVWAMRLGRQLSPETIVKMVEEEVEQNSRLY